MTAQPSTEASTTSVLALLTQANRDVAAARKAEAEAKTRRVDLIVKARMQGIAHNVIASAITDDDGKPMSVARVMQLAHKAMKEQGLKAPRGKQAGEGPTQPAATSRRSVKAPVSKAEASKAGKATPAPKPSQRARTRKPAAKKA